MPSRETYVMRNGRLVLKREAAPLVVSGAAPFVISDLAPYRAVAADKHNGSRPVIGGRRQHREFLSRNGYTEVGNERVTPRREEMSRSDRVSDIKRAIER